MVKRWLFLLQLMVMCLMLPVVAVGQQGTQAEPFGMIVNDAQIEAWLGREARVNHPVIKHLASRETETLQFYFERAYGQRAESVIRTAAQARAKTMRFLPAETVSDVHIYLLGDMNRYFEAQDSPGRAPEWAAGLTLLRDGVILIRLSPRGTTKLEPERTLAHELNHVALRRFVQDNQVPHWFYEGFAMLATDDWGLNRAETLGRASMSGRLIELDALNQAFGKTGAIVDLAYAQSAHFVSWLAKEYGDDAVKKLLSDVAIGHSFDKAFFTAFGRSPKAAFATWRDNMSREESLWASIFSHDGIFFMISVFAVAALSIALWRRTKIRRRRLAEMHQDIPETVLPENLRHFGPFARK